MKYLFLFLFFIQVSYAQDYSYYYSVKNEIREKERLVENLNSEINTLEMRYDLYRDGEYCKFFDGTIRDDCYKRGEKIYDNIDRKESLKRNLESVIMILERKLREFEENEEKERLIRVAQEEERKKLEEERKKLEEEKKKEELRKQTCSLLNTSISETKAKLSDKKTKKKEVKELNLSLEKEIHLYIDSSCASLFSVVKSFTTTSTIKTETDEEYLERMSKIDTEKRDLLCSNLINEYLDFEGLSKKGINKIKNEKQLESFQEKFIEKNKAKIEYFQNNLSVCSFREGK